MSLTADDLAVSEFDGLGYPSFILYIKLKMPVLLAVLIPNHKMLILIRHGLLNLSEVETLVGQIVQVNLRHRQVRLIRLRHQVRLVVVTNASETATVHIGVGLLATVELYTCLGEQVLVYNLLPRPLFFVWANYGPVARQLEALAILAVLELRELLLILHVWLDLCHVRAVYGLVALRGGEGGL